MGNVDARLRQVFGEEYGLVVETAPGAGTKVSFRVPKFAPWRPGVVMHGPRSRSEPSPEPSRRPSPEPSRWTSSEPSRRPGREPRRRTFGARPLTTAVLVILVALVLLAAFTRPTAPAGPLRARHGRWP